MRPRRRPPRPLPPPRGGLTPPLARTTRRSPAGLIHENDKEYTDALRAYKTALQIREAELGTNIRARADSARLVSSRARGRWLTDRLPGAVLALVTGLHDDTLRSLSDVADVYDALGDAVQAARYRNRAVQMTIQILQHHTNNGAAIARERDLVDEFLDDANVGAMVDDGDGQ